MARSLVNVQWEKSSHAVAAFLTVMIMPLTYSIAYGLIAGIGIYYVIEGVYFILSFVGIKNPSGVDESEEEEKEEPVKEEKFDEDA